MDTEARARAVEGEPPRRLGLELLLALRLLLLRQVRRQLQRHLAQQAAAQGIPQRELAVHADRGMHIAVGGDGDGALAVKLGCRGELHALRVLLAHRRAWGHQDRLGGRSGRHWNLARRQLVVAGEATLVGVALVAHGA